MLSVGLWRSRFGSNEAILGKTVLIDEDPFTVIGVLPRGFGLSTHPVEKVAVPAPELWVPFGANPGMLTPNNHTLELIGRLRPEVSITAALAEAEPLLRGDRPLSRRGANLIPRAEAEVGEVRRPLLLLLASVGLLLLITCGNVRGERNGTAYACGPRRSPRATPATAPRPKARPLRWQAAQRAFWSDGGACGRCFYWRPASFLTRRWCA